MTDQGWRAARVEQAAYDTVVIGAGLAGLTAALRLAEAGQRVAVLAKGVGATHLSPATIDVLGYDDGSSGLSPIGPPTPGFSYPYESSDGYSYPYLSPGGFSYPYFGQQEPPAH